HVNAPPPLAPQGRGRGRAPRRTSSHRGPRGDPLMTTCFTATPGVDVITTTAEIPPLGSLAINAFVLHGTEPVLVDTGTVASSAEFMSALTSVIDPGALRWIWLTHTDFDHIGSLATLLDANPYLR